MRRCGRWNQRLVAPLRLFEDLWAVSARSAHNVGEGRNREHVRKRTPRARTIARRVERRSNTCSRLCEPARCPQTREYNASSSGVLDRALEADELQARAAACSNTHAHVFDPLLNDVTYCSAAQAELRTVHIRDSVNRGPLALRADVARDLGFFDEQAFARVCP